MQPQTSRFQGTERALKQGQLAAVEALAEEFWNIKRQNEKDSNKVNKTNNNTIYVKLQALEVDRQKVREDLKSGRSTEPQAARELFDMYLKHHIDEHMAALKNCCEILEQALPYLGSVREMSRWTVETMELKRWRQELEQLKRSTDLLV